MQRWLTQQDTGWLKKMRKMKVAPCGLVLLCPYRVNYRSWCIISQWWRLTEAKSAKKRRQGGITRSAGGRKKQKDLRIKIRILFLREYLSVVTTNKYFFFLYFSWRRWLTNSAILETAAGDFKFSEAVIKFLLTCRFNEDDFQTPRNKQQILVLPLIIMPPVGSTF